MSDVDESRYPGMAAKIVEQCDASPPMEMPDDDRIFTDIEDDRTSKALLNLYRKGVVEAKYDEEAGETRWALTEFGVELCERGLYRAYIASLEDEIQLDATPKTMEVLQR
jgi:hypothetical protein